MSATLLLEPIGGISGDLFLGALADLGVDFGPLQELLAGVGIAGFALELAQAADHGIHGTRATVRLAENAPTHVHRAWVDIRRILERLPAPVAPRAIAIFERLAKAEAKVHGVREADVEFHEIGAVDSIVDVVGAAYGLDRLGSPKVVSRPPPLGSGLAKSQHGTIPIPAPATAEILAGLPTLLEGRGELTTPTGAAILAACASFDLPGGFSAERIGYGVGHVRHEDRPNLLRASLGTTAGVKDPVYVLETHLDDLNPQVLAHLAELLLAAGALDVGLSPLMMKKGRTGQRLTIVCRAADRAALSEMVFRESTTLGIRVYPVEREELDRRMVEVETLYGKVRVKLGLLRGKVVNAQPEYDDCVRAAQQHRVPLKEVMAEASAAARQATLPSR